MDLERDQLSIDQQTNKATVYQDRIDRAIVKMSTVNKRFLLSTNRINHKSTSKHRCLLLYNHKPENPAWPASEHPYYL